MIRLHLLIFIVTGTQGSLTDYPQDNVVFIGETNVFTCCSDIRETIFWKHKRVGSAVQSDIYDLNGLVNGYRSNRFNVTYGNSPGCYNFVTKDVTRGDAGTYSCDDNAGLGHSKTWELIILEYFGCQEANRTAEYMGVNNFGLPQDVISAVCVSKYFGNLRPKPICEWSSGTKLLDNYHHLTEMNLTITLNIQIPATKELNGHRLFCYVKNGDSSDNENPAEWKSSQLIINHATIHQKEVPLCSFDQQSLDCQPPCNFTTMHLSNGSSYCEITYPGKTARTIFLPLLDNLPGETNIQSSTRNPVENQTPLSGTTIALILTSVSVLLFAISWMVFLIYRCCKGRCSKQRCSDPVESPATSQLASINIHDGALLTISATPNTNSTSLLGNTICHGNNNCSTERKPFLEGVDKDAPPNFLINIGVSNKKQVKGATWPPTKCRYQEEEKHAIP